MLDAVTATQIAMEFDQLKLQSISHNVANINTPAYKKQRAEHTEFNDYFSPQTDAVLNHIQRSELTNQGAVNQTRIPNNLAISGDGYFQVQGDQGIFYTRRGDFQVNQQGELATATGETLLGTGGTIKTDGASFTIDNRGAVFINHQKIDQLNLVHFNQNSSLKYVGNGLYESEDSPTPCDSNTRILQGFIEQSNVTSVDEMMDMLKTSRHFEANQRILRTADSLLSTAISQLGEGNV